MKSTTINCGTTAKHGFEGVYTQILFDHRELYQKLFDNNKPSYF